MHLIELELNNEQFQIVLHFKFIIVIIIIQCTHLNLYITPMHCRLLCVHVYIYVNIVD